MNALSIMSCECSPEGLCSALRREACPAIPHSILTLKLLALDGGGLEKDRLPGTRAAGTQVLRTIRHSQAAAWDLVWRLSGMGLG